MPKPWDPDRKLDVATARKTLAAQFPELPLGSVEFLGSGWDFDAYLVNGDLVARFPRRAEIAALLTREEKILAFVGDLIGEALTIPRIVLKGKKGAHFPYRFFCYSFIRGVAADDESIRKVQSLADDLGNALTIIHSIPMSSNVEGLIGNERETCRERFVETLDLFESHQGIKDTVPEAVRWLRSDPEVPNEFDSSPRFLHNDLCPDHLIVDVGTGRLSGIIDWSDAAYGDPVWDFVVLAVSRGVRFTDKVISSYGLQVDEGFHQRLRFLGKTSSIKWLIDASRRDDDIEKHVRWVVNAFDPRS